MRALILAALVVLSSPAIAEVVYVKYRGAVDLAPFSCQTTGESSLVNRICYDAKERYLLVSLKGTYYHYCEISNAAVSGWLRAQSKGRFYLAYVKGKYDCRTGHVPAYSQSPTPRDAQPTFNVDRGVRNYQDVIAGRKRLDQLSPIEQREVLTVTQRLARRRGAGEPCDVAYSSCTDECTSTGAYFDYEEGVYRTTQDTDFWSNCESACSAGQSNCEDEDDRDSKRDEFRSGCESDCPTSVFDYRAGEFRLLTDADSKCEDACSAGASSCE